MHGLRFWVDMGLMTAYGDSGNLYIPFLFGARSWDLWYLICI